MKPVFITGTGTDVGKTVVAAIVTGALNAAYWKPVQAGALDNTDSDFVQQYTSSSGPCCKEVYRFTMPASPHVAARNENIRIKLDTIVAAYHSIASSYTAQAFLVIEGAGGIFVPLNENEFVFDLIKKLQAKVILVSRNYLGSINHSLMTAAVCKQHELDVAGWIFNDQFMEYETEIANWSGYPVIGKIPRLASISTDSIFQQSLHIRPGLLQYLQ